MSEYMFSQIMPSEKSANRKMDALLAQEGIRRDGNLDYSLGVFNEDLQLVATGSCFRNTLRCMAVDRRHQGEGLLNQVISHLISVQYERGNTDLFLYTKADTGKFFRDLGFYEIARVEGKMIFMENRRENFPRYLDSIRQSTIEKLGILCAGSASGLSGEKDPAPGLRCAGIVMNANPFTLGHLALVEKASAENDLVHLFVISEDESLVPFAVRERLVREGTAHLPNLIYHRTESYMISNATFPSYFLKDADDVILSQARLDTEVFLRIAKAARITSRYAGDEPFSHVTSLYNKVMKETLSRTGIDCVIMPRAEKDGRAISASAVRQAVREGRIEDIRALVPDATYEYFCSAEAAPVIRRIREEKDVIHY